MSRNSLPKGRTRISSAVVDTVAMTAAREVRGVIDIVRLTKGAALGAAVGGVVGMVGGGVGGAVIGASAGTAAGATTAHLLNREQKRRSFHAMDESIPPFQVHLSAVYGRDLVQLARDVRAQVRQSIRDTTGLDAPEIEVIFTEVVGPQRRSTRKPPTTTS